MNGCKCVYDDWCCSCGRVTGSFPEEGRDGSMHKFCKDCSPSEIARQMAAESAPDAGDREDQLQGGS